MNIQKAIEKNVAPPDLQKKRGSGNYHYETDRGDSKETSEGVVMINEARGVSTLTTNRGRSQPISPSEYYRRKFGVHEPPIEHRGWRETLTFQPPSTGCALSDVGRGYGGRVRLRVSLS